MTRKLLTREEAAEMIQLRDLESARATCQRVAEAVASGRLDSDVGGAILACAHTAIGALRALATKPDRPQGSGRGRCTTDSDRAAGPEETKPCPRS